MTRRDRTVLLVVVTAALIGAFWFLVMSPTRKDASALDKKIAAQQQRLTAAETQVSAAQSAKRGYESDYAAVAELGQAVPADDDVASMIYQLDRAARGARIDFRSFKLTATGQASTAAAEPAADAGGAQTIGQLPPGAAVGAAGFPTMPFDFNFDGSFFRMQKFLARVARLTRVRDGGIDVNGRLLTIDRIQISASRKGFPKVRAEISATAFVVPSDEGLTGGATVEGPATGAASDENAADKGAATASASAGLTTGGSR